MDHETGLLFHGHFGEQVGNALVDGKPPVFVAVEHAVLVKVAELQSVLGQDGRFAGLDFWLLRSCKRSRGHNARHGEQAIHGHLAMTPPEYHHDALSWYNLSMRKAFALALAAASYLCAADARPK